MSIRKCQRNNVNETMSMRQCQWDNDNETMTMRHDNETKPMRQRQWDNDNETMPRGHFGKAQYEASKYWFCAWEPVFEIKICLKKSVTFKPMWVSENFEKCWSPLGSNSECFKIENFWMAGYLLGKTYIHFKGIIIRSNQDILEKMNTHHHLGFLQVCSQISLFLLTLRYLLLRSRFFVKNLRRKKYNCTD